MSETDIFSLILFFIFALGAYVFFDVKGKTFEDLSLLGKFVIFVILVACIKILVHLWF